MKQEKIGRYEVKAEVGRGGMATVYRSYDPSFERDVAIKVLPPAFQHDPQFRVRFEREAKTIALLEHPAIVPVYDFGEDQQKLYIVMRFMSGGSLSLRLKEGKMTKEETQQIISRLAPSLDAAHAKGIIHRDIKPGNILFDQYGNAFLSDFGIARITEHAGTTITGNSIIGTPAYMSPEQVQGDKDLDGRSDIYSLGIIVFQMLTGSLPYQSDTPAKTMMMHILDPIPNVSEVNPNLPPDFDDVVTQALAKKPEDRYSTASEMATALEAAMKGEPVPVRQTLAEDTIETPLPTLLHQTEKSTLPSQPETAVIPPQVKRQSKGLYAVLGVVGVVVVLGLIAAALISSRIPIPVIGFIAPSTTATSTITQQAPTKAAPSPTLDSTLISIRGQETEIAQRTLTPEPTPTLTNSPEPTVTPTTTPTNTPTLEPSLPVIGGADKIALIKENDIWIMNVDGTDLSQLTNDGAEKSNLQWSPDGESVNYISGKCAWSANIISGRLDIIACFEVADYLEAFEVSPSGEQVAISLNRELFIVPYDLDKLSQAKYRTDLIEMTECEYFTPYIRGGSSVPVKSVRWSNDEQQIAISKLGVVDGSSEDLIHLLDISECVETPPRLDEFPGRRFKFYDDDTRTVLQNFAWDGQFLFTLYTHKRNGGFGDLWIYNTDLHRSEIINPIDDTCCYRDPYWSPDGRHLIVVYQDQSFGTEGEIQFYYMPFGTIGTGLSYPPMPLPEDFFENPREIPQPVLRPAK
jgi:serine/threonine protein kinase